MQQSESIKNLAAALAAAQKDMRGALRDSENPFFKSSYADLEAVWDACRDPLTKNGLSVAQTTDYEGTDIFVVTTLLHSSGEWMRGRLPIVVLKKDAQSIGSAITYARRYALSAMVGVVQSDDDGEAAMARPPGAKYERPVQQQPPQVQQPQQQQAPQPQVQPRNRPVIQHKSAALPPPKQQQAVKPRKEELNHGVQNFEDFQG